MTDSVFKMAIDNNNIDMEIQDYKMIISLIKGEYKEDQQKSKIFTC